MKLSEDIKPISYLKAHASELVSELGTHQRTLVITQNGKAKAVLQDIHSYEKMQETMALLKMLSQSNQDLKEGKYRSAEEVFADLRKKIGQ